jgi:hypothetical protein
MQSAVQNAIASSSKTALWAGHILSGVIVFFLLFDSALKLMKAPAAIQGTAQLGFQPNVLAGLGITLLCSVLLYAIPRTSVLGAILLTGYLGGAVATQVRVNNPLFSYTLAPVYLGILIWLALYLRLPRLRAVLRLVQ